MAKGLGAGLGALFGEAALESDSMDCVFLPISKVEAGINQPRKIFDDEALDELAESIAEHGIIQPLTVRKLASGYYQIIAGERRWRAARRAGLDKVPVRIVEADDRKAMELALIENLQRENLNPIEEAEGYRSLIEDYNFTQEEAAQRVGKARPTVTNALRLLSLPQKVRGYLEDGSISAGHARAILSVKDEELQIKLADKIAAEKLSVRQAETLSHKFTKGNKTLAKEEINYLEEIERRLGEGLGRKVRILAGKKKGRLELEFYGNDDLDDLIAEIESLIKKRGTEL